MFFRIERIKPDIIYSILKIIEISRFDEDAEQGRKEDRRYARGSNCGLLWSKRGACRGKLIRCIFNAGLRSADPSPNETQMKTFKKKTKAPIPESEKIVGGDTDRKTLEARKKRFEELFEDLA